MGTRGELRRPCCPCAMAGTAATSHTTAPVTSVASRPAATRAAGMHTSRVRALPPGRTGHAPSGALVVLCKPCYGGKDRLSRAADRGAIRPALQASAAALCGRVGAASRAGGDRGHRPLPPRGPTGPFSVTRLHPRLHRRPADELAQVLVGGREVLLPQVHHVAAAVTLEAHAVLEPAGGVHVPHGV